MRAFYLSFTALSLSLCAPSWAEELAQLNQPLHLEQLLVTSRMDSDEGAMMPTIITAEEIKQSPARNLTSLLGREMGTQTTNTNFSTNGSVDMRGFGAAGVSNTLILLNGRRLNDLDLAAVNLDTVPIDSLDRIEILRGNSGAVLYGDGAVGGVINLVTKSALHVKDSGYANLGYGSFGAIEADAGITKRFGKTSLSAHGKAGYTDGWRDNSENRAQNIQAELRQQLSKGEVYANIAADRQFSGLPGPVSYNLKKDAPNVNPKTADTPYDWAKRDGVQLAIGGFWNFSPKAMMLADLSWRRKNQESQFKWTGSGSNTDTELDTIAFSPRLQLETGLGKSTIGVDLSHTSYDSKRAEFGGSDPVNVYDLSQKVAGVYGQNLARIGQNWSLTTGARLQWHDLSAKDTFDPNAPGGSWGVEATDLDQSQTNWAANLGLEYTVTPDVAIFGRAARAFRLPNVDERVGAGYPSNFRLKTQTSWDAELGAKTNIGPLNLIGSVWYMELDNEIHYLPDNSTNVNLDPTRRIGAEAQALWDINDDLRLKGALTHTSATFREGDYAGQDVPLVSRWTGMMGISADLYQDYVRLDLDARYVGARHYDNDQANEKRKIGAHTLVDMKFSGEVQAFNWSLAVHNVFDEEYYDYAVASTSNPAKANAYLMPGRTYMGRVGVKF